MDFNLPHCASHDDEFDLIQLANPPDRLFYASQITEPPDCSNGNPEPPDCSNGNPEPPDYNNGNFFDEDLSHTRSPLRHDNAQPSVSNLRSENNQLSNQNVYPSPFMPESQFSYLDTSVKNANIQNVHHSPFLTESQFSFPDISIKDASKQNIKP